MRRAIDEGIVTREEVFITTKLVPWGYDDYDAAIEKANETLGLGYIDLFLIHQRGVDEKELYRAIENAIEGHCPVIGDFKLLHTGGFRAYYRKRQNNARCYSK